MTTRLRAAYVIGHDGHDHVVYRDGEIVVHGSNVIFVGHDYSGSVDEEHDHGLAIIAPGFVDLNALGDIDHHLLHHEVASSAASALLWSRAYLDRGPRDVLSSDDDRFMSRYALALLLLNGITTALPVTNLLAKAWAETEEAYDRIVEEAVALGIRVYLGPSYRSAVHVVEADGRRSLYSDPARGAGGLRSAEAFCRRHDRSHGDLVRGLLVPSTVETCSEELLRATRAISDDNGYPIRLHVGQSLREFDLLDDGRTPIEYLGRIGFLGRRALLAHAILVRGHSRVPLTGSGDVDLMAASGATVIHCPIATGRHGLNLESFDTYRDRGVNVALGTDQFPPDMILAMQLASTLVKSIGDGQGRHAADVYRAATVWGAHALGRDDLGRLAPGAKADIVVLDLAKVEVGQHEDPIRTIILNLSGRDVRSVYVDGRLVVRDRCLPGVDFAELRVRSQRVFEQLRAAYADRDYLGRDSATVFASTFRVVERRQTTAARTG